MSATKIQDFLADCQKAFAQIPSDRKKVLETLSDFIEDRLNEPLINLIFICVHNSRRSHFSQVWAQIAAVHYGFNNVQCYSGGTEVTAMHPQVADTLHSQGIEVKIISEGINPVYALKSTANATPILGFSKLYDDPFNPQSDFGAIMVCSTADSNCPYISTAATRILIPFEDPKVFDKTPKQMEGYQERSKQIATEFLYAFSLVNV